MTVAPGSTATTSLTVRNDSDIVEAYSLEVVGDCASWATVEPPRVSLYPGTSETVTIRLEPPRSPEIRAGELPLGVRVLPAEHPDAVTVPETTVHIEEFHELRTELAPRRRRGWLRGRYRLAVRNQGNTPVQVGFTPGQAGEELAFAFNPAEPKLEPGESVEVGLRVRTGKPVWFGSPAVWPFTLAVAETGDRDPTQPDETAGRPPLDAEFVQIPIFPKWLLAVLAALLALLLAWFTLVRPAVRSAAKEAANEVVQPRPTPAGEQGGNGQTPGASGSGGASASPDGQGKGNGSGAGGDGTSTGTGTAVGAGQQSSATIDLKTAGGDRHRHLQGAREERLRRDGHRRRQLPGRRRGDDDQLRQPQDHHDRPGNLPQPGLPLGHPHQDPREQHRDHRCDLHEAGHSGHRPPGAGMSRSPERERRGQPHRVSRTSSSRSFLIGADYICKERPSILSRIR